MFNRDPQQKANAQRAKKFKRLLKEKRHDEALKVGEEYLLAVPDHPDVLFMVGGIHYMEKRYDVAISYFDQALEIGSHDVDVLLLKAYSHQKLGQKKNAIRCCNTIMQVDPKNTLVQMLLPQLR